MTCFYPLQGWRSRTVSSSGKRPITFDIKKGYSDMPQTVECGRCIGCRLDLSRQWAIRCMHEAYYNEDNCYITLTYSPKHLPPGATLLLEDWRYFIKKLRRAYPDIIIRYYHSGEYGVATKENGQIARPHYHALLFNIAFRDKILFKEINGIPLYTSDKLSRIWGKGHASVGEITMQSAAYVARYIMKKQYPSRHDEQANKKYKENYERVNRDTGEIKKVKPEYSTMSRNIGIEWFREFNKDVYNKDFLTYKGEKFKPPKYYDRLYSDLHPERMEKIKTQRLKSMKKQEKNHTLDRLRTRERVKILQSQKLPRTLGEQLC